MIVKLNQNIDCTSLCKQIAKMIERFRKENSLDNKVISVKIVELVDGGDNHIKKIGEVKHV